MELFYCDQCEKRIAQSEVGEAKAHSAATGGKMFCAACRPKVEVATALPAKPPTAEMKAPLRSTVRLPRNTPNVETGSRRSAVNIPSARKSPMRGENVGAGINDEPEANDVAAVAQHRSPARGQNTAVPFRAGISNRAAPAIQVPAGHSASVASKATAPARPATFSGHATKSNPASAGIDSTTKVRNWPMIIGLYVAVICIVGVGAVIIWQPNRSRQNAAVTDASSDATTATGASVNPRTTTAPPTPPVALPRPSPEPAPVQYPATPLGPPKATVLAPPRPVAPPLLPPDHSRDHPADPPRTRLAPPPVVVNLADLPVLHAVALSGAPPKIDGIMDDAAWRDAPSIEMKIHTDGKPGNGKARVYMLYDDKNLYFFVQCFEDPLALTALKADATQTNGGNVWEDDSVEFFIDTANTRKTYYQIVLNSKGVTWTALIPKVSAPDTSWKPKLELVTSVGQVSWTAELSLPLSSFDRLKMENEWAFNVVHTRTAAKELISWSNLNSESNHTPARFGRLLDMPTK